MTSLAISMIVLSILISRFHAGESDFTTKYKAKRNLMQNLIQEILKENNKAFLPRLNETQPVEVLFDFELITIREVNAKDQTISVYGWIRQRWNNPLLQWNASEYGGIDSIQTSANSVWVPDILIYNK